MSILESYIKGYTSVSKSSLWIPTVLTYVLEVHWGETSDVVFVRQKFISKVMGFWGPWISSFVINTVCWCLQPSNGLRTKVLKLISIICQGEKKKKSDRFQPQYVSKQLRWGGVALWGLQFWMGDNICSLNLPKLSLQVTHVRLLCRSSPSPPPPFWTLVTDSVLLTFLQEVLKQVN